MSLEKIFTTLCGPLAYDDPSLRGTGTGALVGAAPVILGCWFPWVRKLPVDYSDDQPIYTREYISGLEVGFRSLDYVLVVLTPIAIGTLVVARNRGVRVSGLLAVTGVVAAGLGTAPFLDFRAVDRYVVEPGLYPVLAGAAVLLALGVGGLVQRSTVAPSECPRSPENQAG